MSNLVIRLCCCPKSAKLVLNHGTKIYVLLQSVTKKDDIREALSEIGGVQELNVTEHSDRCHNDATFRAKHGKVNDQAVGASSSMGVVQSLTTMRGGEGSAKHAPGLPIGLWS